VRLFDMMAENPDAQLIAGATELGLEITKKFRRFPLLISLEAIPELSAITSSDAEWKVGAAATLTRLDEALGAEYPELREMLLVFGSRQIRNRATIGGNIVTASPIGDCAPVLLSLDARVVLASMTGERVLPIEEFFVSYRKTALQRGEILKSILLPRKNAGDRWMRRYCKVSKRREMDISTVAAAFSVRLASDGTVEHARLAYGGVAAMPLRARATEDALVGKPWNADTCGQVLPILANEFVPISDVRGSANYRRGLIATLLRKFFAEEPHATVAKEESGRGDLCVRGVRPSSIPHESAHKHVTGEAVYVDDHAQREQMLETWPVCSPHARARIIRRDASAARGCPACTPSCWPKMCRA
jgi:xanthine dehydrogenase iron-sulfur cluster and FAD-binding subunit A